MRGRTNVKGGGMSINGNLTSAIIDEGQTIFKGDFVEYKSYPSQKLLLQNGILRAISFEDFDNGLRIISGADASLRYNSTTDRPNCLFLVKSTDKDVEILFSQNELHQCIGKVGNRLLYVLSDEIRLYNVNESGLTLYKSISFSGTPQHAVVLEDENKAYLFAFQSNTSTGYIYKFNIVNEELVSDGNVSGNMGASNTFPYLSSYLGKYGNKYAFTEYASSGSGSNFSNYLRLRMVDFDGSSISSTNATLSTLTSVSANYYGERFVSLGSKVIGKYAIVFPTFETVSGGTSGYSCYNSIRIVDMESRTKKDISFSSLGLLGNDSYIFDSSAYYLGQNRFLVITRTSNSSTSLGTNMVASIIRFDEASSSIEVISNKYIFEFSKLNRDGSYLGRGNYFVALDGTKISIIAENKTDTNVLSLRYIGNNISGEIDKNYIKQWNGSSIFTGIANDDGMEGDTIDFYIPDVNI